MNVQFFIRFHTQPGQSLVVIGNAAELGRFSINQGFRLRYHNPDFWEGSIDIQDSQVTKLNYKYVLLNEGSYDVLEWGRDRVIDLSKAGTEGFQVIDTWNHAGEFENAFYTDPFQETLLKSRETAFKKKSPKVFTHVFKVKAPLLRKNEIPCVLGNLSAMGNWSVNQPRLLVRENGWWSVKLNLGIPATTVIYKYGVYDLKHKKLVRYEEGENRFLLQEFNGPHLTVLHDGFVHMPNSSWKGAGMAVPVFSLRGKHSFGVGEFNDIRLLVDWAKKCGLKLLQILPVNDTTATHSWMDSYPYAAISAFALHPIYINLETVAGKEYALLLRPLKKKQKQLNDLAELDYEEVMRLKLAALRELFQVQQDDFLADESFKTFFDKNRHWLIPYAAFCYLRDRNGTSDFNKWKLYSSYRKDAIEKYVSPKARHYDEIAFHYFLQYHLHNQLKEAADYAHKQGIILKGDIPIGIYRFGCDAWMEPDLYHMDRQAGAPPDDFAELGQNWGFPTYNWEQMAEDGFEWWHRRFVQMNNYYDAFRIDHILGFFRIWSIPIDAVEGIMGRFDPALPVTRQECNHLGMTFDEDRFCKPYITDAILWELFGPNDSKFKAYLSSTGEGRYGLKPAFSTQRDVEEHFSELEDSEENRNLKLGLFELISNVIFFPEPGPEGNSYHFRFAVEKTASFRHLPGNVQDRLRELYVNYYFRRQDTFWMGEAMKKLPALKESTNMLVCGEDLGLVPHCVPDAMKQLGILSLEIQRMPKTPGRAFFHPADAPYLSVVTPSTHDMSTIRGWWEEDRNRTQLFFNQELGEGGPAPYFCEPWINKAIILQHLYSPAMWSIFLLQDILGMSEKLRREDPHAERINVPANPRHYWRYRMHLNLEDLIREKAFNEEFRGLVESSGR